MPEMTKKELEAFKFFLSQWKNNWDLNQYYRTWYDTDLEYYRGYKQPYTSPLAYDLSFNKLMPRIYTVLSRFMEQLYQAGTSDLVSVRPRKRADVDRAPRIQGLLNYQLESLNDIDMQGGSYLHNFHWMFNALTFGKGISKLYWRKEERIAPRRVTIPRIITDNMGRPVDIQPEQILVEDNQVIYDGPYAEVVHNKLFNPHPHYKSIQKMPFVGCVYKRSIDYIRRMAEKGVYDKKAIKMLGFTGTHTSSSYAEDSAEAFAKSLEIEGASEKELSSGNDDRRTPEIDVIEGYGRYILPEDEKAYEVGSGYKIKGKESEVIVHIGNYKTLLSLKKNKYGIRPFFDIGAYYHPELYWDIGLIRLGKDLQQQYDTMGNLRFQNVMLLVNAMAKVQADSDIDPAALIARPGGLIPVDEMTDYEPIVHNDAFASGAFQQMENFFEEAISDMTGLYPYNMGSTPPCQEHVGTIYSLQSMGEARTKLLLMTMDHTGFRPFLKHMMLLNTYHLDPRMEARINTNNGTKFAQLFAGDFHADYDFSARYTAMEPALGKQFRAQQLIQYAQMWQESPYLQHYQFMKAIMELLDFHDSDRYLRSPQEVAKMQQQQAQMAVQQQMMEYQLEDSLSANQAERDTKRDVVKALMKG